MKEEQRLKTIRDILLTLAAVMGAGILLGYFYDCYYDLNDEAANTFAPIEALLANIRQQVERYVLESLITISRQSLPSRILVKEFPRTKYPISLRDSTRHRQA